MRLTLRRPKVPEPVPPTYDYIAAAMVLRNEGHRIGALVAALRPHFTTIAIAVQDSTDDTLEQAQLLADVFVTDVASGFGDSTFGPKLLPLIQEPWTFKVDGDELPDEALLLSLGAAIRVADANDMDCIHVPFRSWIEDEEWTQPHGHVRLFRTILGWPGKLHSRPPSDRILKWPSGHIAHRKSLDEHVRGYLGYLAAGAGHRGWDDHNRAMIWHACVGIATAKGWAFVQSFEWWPEVNAAVFNGQPPPVPEP